MFKLEIHPLFTYTYTGPLLVSSLWFLNLHTVPLVPCTGGETYVFQCSQEQDWMCLCPYWKIQRWQIGVTVLALGRLLCLLFHLGKTKQWKVFYRSFHFFEYLAGYLLYMKKKAKWTFISNVGYICLLSTDYLSVCLTDSHIPNESDQILGA